MTAPHTFTDNSISLQSGQNFYPNAGGRDITNLVLRKGYTTENLLVNVSNYLSTDTISLFTEYSTDGGATWFGGGGSDSFSGGSQINPKNGHQGIGYISDMPDIDSNASGLLQRFNIIVPRAGTIGPASLTLS